MKNLSQFHRKLHAWYAKYGRKELPWRNTEDPYHIYISEVMLQQTQVKTVLERYYFPFLKTFPTLEALAAAPQQSVMKAWEGLGYYTRAGNLHKAANQCVSTLPRTVDALIALPGIGKNTAHAIAAFGFKQPYAVMEANVKRVICRVFALKNPTPDVLWEKAELLLDPKNPFDYNQAMMDIGALVCTKTLPHCSICPLNQMCEGKHAPTLYPAKAKKKAVPVRKKNIVILMNAKQEIYLARREEKFLNGLYGFIEIDRSIKTFSHDEQYYRLSKKQLIGSISQAYSHFMLDADVYLLKSESAAKGYYTLKNIDKLPLSKADMKALACLQNVAI
jgi:A/G-specific adenine glycosylase